MDPEPQETHTDYAEAPAEAPQQEEEQSLSDLMSSLWDEQVNAEESTETPDETWQDHVEAAPEEKSPPPGAEPMTAPAHWSEEDRTLFEAQSDDMKQFMLARDQALTADTNQNPQYDSGSDVGQLVALNDQYKDYFASQGMTTAQGFQWLAQAQAGLVNGSIEQRQAALAQIAQAYGLSFTPGTNQDDDFDDFRDPDLVKVIERQNLLENVLLQQQQAEAARQRAIDEQTVSNFATEVDENGNLKHPHFEAVRHVMAGIIVQEGSLEAAYKKAVAPIEAYFKSQTEKLTEQQEAERLERLKRAKKVAPSNTKSTTPPVVPERKIVTVRDAAVAAYDELSQR